MRPRRAALAATGRLAAIAAAAFVVAAALAYSASFRAVVVPEGFRLHQIFARLSARLGLDESELWEIEKDPAARAELAGMPIATLEGLIPPAMYRLRARALGHRPDPRRLLERLVARIPEGLDRFYGGASGGSSDASRVYDTLIVASLVERETADPTERGLVASVIRNRLAAGMRLELCSSLLYALPPGRDEIRAVDLSLLSPYNLYLREGLPPSPICSPGRDAFEAAAMAPESEYLYFRLAEDGSHRFSKSYAEHVAGSGG